MKDLNLFSDAQLADLASQTRREILQLEAEMLLLKSKLVRAQCVALLRMVRTKLEQIEGEQKARAELAALAS